MNDILTNTPPSTLKLPSGFTLSVMKRFMTPEQIQEFALKYKQHKKTIGRVNTLQITPNNVALARRYMVEGNITTEEFLTTLGYRLSKSKRQKELNENKAALLAVRLIKSKK